MSDDLLNLKKYPQTMFMDMYGNGSQCWDRADKQETDPFDVVFRAKYIRIDLALERTKQVTERNLKAQEVIKHDEFYHVISELHASINNAGWEDRHSKQIETLWRLMEKYNTEKTND